MSSPPAGGRPEVLLDPDRYSPVQRRTIDTAMDLFATHGVRGTSFRMLADRLGVTKAAIYHQFRSKDAIVLAVAEVGMAPLETALLAAESRASSEEARLAMLTSVVDMAVARRAWVGALQGDPVIIQLLGSHPPFIELMTRIYALLLGLGDDPSARVRTAIVSAAIGGAIVHPLVTDLDDATLRRELLTVTTRLFELDH